MNYTGRPLVAGWTAGVACAVGLASVAYAATNSFVGNEVQFGNTLAFSPGNPDGNYTVPASGAPVFTNSIVE